MANTDSINGKKRPCCQLLRQLAAQPELLKDSNNAAQFMATMEKHCIVMQFQGKTRSKIDFAQSTCYMDMNPETAQAIIDEAGKTAAVNPDLAAYYDLLAKINHSLANNAKLQQINERMQLFLAQVREGERRFGRVPTTDLLKDNNNENTLEAGNALKTHPLLDKPQFDGITPKSNPNPVQNPEAAKNAEELQYRLQYRPQQTFTPKPEPRR
jgi:hypothetical protein